LKAIKKAAYTSPGSLTFHTRYESNLAAGASWDQAIPDAILEK